MPNLLSPSSGLKYNLEIVDSMFPRNAGIYVRVYTAPKPRRTSSDIKGVSERVLRGIFGPKKEEVTGGWRKLLRCFMICIRHQILSSH
jgi:hypothetical protein